jgi:hypothetical protein
MHEKGESWDINSAAAGFLVCVAAIWVGGIAAILTNSSRVIKMEGFSQEQREKYLKKLRSKARFPEYK